MYDFLDSWDSILASYKLDIEVCIRNGVRSWIIATQSYCERLFKLFNAKEKILINDRSLSLGVMLNDFVFVETFVDKTGFNDINTVRRINEKANSAKHAGKIDTIEIDKYLKSIYVLTVKTYNYIFNKSVEESWDDSYIDKLTKNTNEDEIIEYAEMIIEKKNKIIEDLKDDLETMGIIALDDIADIEKLKNGNNLLNAKIKNQSEDIVLYENAISGIEQIIRTTSSQDSELLLFFDRKESNMTWLEFFKKELTIHQKGVDDMLDANKGFYLYSLDEC